MSEAIRARATVSKRIVAAALELVPLVEIVLPAGQPRYVVIPLALAAGLGWLLLGHRDIAVSVWFARLSLLFVAGIAGALVGLRFGGCSDCTDAATYVARGIWITGYVVPPVVSALFAFRDRGDWW